MLVPIETGAVIRCDLFLLVSNTYCLSFRFSAKTEKLMSIASRNKKSLDSKFSNRNICLTLVYKVICKFCNGFASFD